MRRGTQREKSFTSISDCQHHEWISTHKRNVSDSFRIAQSSTAPIFLNVNNLSGSPDTWSSNQLWADVDDLKRNSVAISPF
jgi:hypothetical protein